MSLPAPALPTSALSTGLPWEIVVEAYLDAAIDSIPTRRAYERHLRHAFAVLGVRTVERGERWGPRPLPGVGASRPT